MPKSALPTIATIANNRKTSMHPTAILHEAQKLHSVSDRLELLPNNIRSSQKRLITVSGSVRHSATLLEILVATKMMPLSEFDPASA
jgi:hypothetical protein